MVVFLIIFIIITAFLISMFYFSLRERIDNAEREADSLLNTISNSIVSDIDGYKELSRLIMMDSGRIVVDIKGKEKEGLTVQDLLQKFEIDNDAMLLSD